MRTCEDFVTLARICVVQARATTNAEVASELNRMANEYLDKAAALNGGRRPTLDEFSRPSMVPVVYRCPNTGLRVQAWFAEGGSDNGNTYETVTCTACGKVHLVNPHTGKMPADDKR